MAKPIPTVASSATPAQAERVARTKANRRGRSAPSVIPAKLTRTPAFRPARHGLREDATFVGVYALPPHSVVEVRGRELGTVHRDVLVALFRERATTCSTPNPAFRPGEGDWRNGPRITYLEVATTWRRLLQASGRQPHANNLRTVLRVLEELRGVNFRFYNGTWESAQQFLQTGRMPSGSGWSDGLISLIEWEGTGINDRVTVRYGDCIRRFFEQKQLVSLDAEVYQRLRTDYGKALWPFLDGKPSYTYVDEVTVATLFGYEYETMDGPRRRDLRVRIRQAFDDLVRAGGLRAWKSQTLGEGRRKIHRYSYEHARPRQAELDLLAS